MRKNKIREPGTSLMYQQIQNNSKGTVVDEADFHLCPKTSGLHIGYGCPAFFYDIFIEGIRPVRLARFYEAGAVSFFTVCVQREL